MMSLQLQDNKNDGSFYLASGQACDLFGMSKGRTTCHIKIRVVLPEEKASESRI